MQNAIADPDLPVAIVGAGFSGTLLAINLLRQGVKVAIVERDDAQIAKGLAFGTRNPEHLLNVRAANMSAFPDDSDHFLRWLGAAASDHANRFVPRRVYGEYLRELLAEALAASPQIAGVWQGEAIGARFAPEAVTLALADGRSVECRSLVLALGNFPPPRLNALSELPPELYVPDPWQANAVEGLEGAEHVVLIGSGLTAVDVILAIDATGFRGRITVLSRRGLKPRSHAESGPRVKHVGEPVARGSWLVRAMRERARAVGWREAVDELRPHTQDLWRRHSDASQRSFLRHLRPYWDVHRHRLAPAVAERMAAIEGEGRLRFVGGALVGAGAEDGSAHIAWRPRGTAALETLVAQRVISCIGPDGDLTRAEEPLLRNLFAQARARPDAHRLGLDVDRTGRVRDAAGAPQDQLYAVGTLTKGESWEIVAVPDIRRQVWELARYLSNAHWVEGSGL